MVKMNAKGATIAMVEDSTLFKGVFRLESALCSKSRLGKKYWKLQVSDCSGLLDAYYWGKPEIIPEPNSMVWLSGKGRCLGRKLICDVASMIGIASWDGCPLLLAPYDVPFPEESMVIANMLDMIEDKELKSICFRTLSERQMLISVLRAPGSLRHHHAYPGGLIRHTRETMEIVSKQATDLTSIEKDLLLTAAFLHDLGKAFEYKQQRMTDRGSLLGHEVTLLELLGPIMNDTWDMNHPTRLTLLHFLVAKPAPQWTGIRHPRSALVNILRFADKLSGEMDLQSKSNRYNPVRSMLHGHSELRARVSV